MIERSHWKRGDYQKLYASSPDAGYDEWRSRSEDRQFFSTLWKLTTKWPLEYAHTAQLVHRVIGTDDGTRAFVYNTCSSSLLTRTIESEVAHRRKEFTRHKPPIITARVYLQLWPWARRGVILAFTAVLALLVLSIGYAKDWFLAMIPVGVALSLYERADGPIGCPSD